MTTTEGTFATRDGMELYTKTWVPGTASPLHLIFIHGFSDHINAYHNLFPRLSSAPYSITVHGFDQRGWGRSAHKKSDWGLTGDTHQVLSDIHDYIHHVSKSIAATDANAKVFVMGHSMGGGESLMYFLSDRDCFGSQQSLPISGLLLESPFIGFPPESQPNTFTVIAGRLAARLLPNMQMVQKLDPSYLSRDPTVGKAWAEDPLCHDTGTLAGLAGLLDRARYLDNLGKGIVTPQTGMRSTLPCPVWWAHGTADKVCNFNASKRLYDKLQINDRGNEAAGWSKLVAYEGGYHKLHAEPHGMSEQFAKDAGDWILQIASLGKEGYTSSGIAQDRDQPTTAGTTASEAGGAQSVKSRL